MKKFKYLCLSFLFVLCGTLFCACSDEVLAKTIYLIDYPSSSSVIEIETSQRIDATVAMMPSNVTNREFEASVLTEGKQDLLSFEYDFSNMKLSLVATNDLGTAKTVTIRIKIKAKASDASSTVQVKIVAPDSPDSRVLSAPEVTLDSTGNLSWGSVEGASSYLVQICEGQTVIKSQTVKNALSYQITDLLQYAGKSMTAKVQSKARTSDLDSTFSIIYFDVLDKPKNLRFESDAQRLVWDEVENANGYNLKIGNKIYHTEQNSFDANGYFDAVGTKNVSVMSAGSTNNRYLPSQYSAEISVSRLQSVSGWRLDGDVLNWSDVDGALKYGIKISNGQNEIVTECANNYIDLSKQNIDAGNHTIFVFAVGQNGGSQFAVNSESRQFNFQKLGKVTGLKLKDGKIEWNSTASVYKILIDGEVYKETRSASFDYSQIALQTMTNLNIVAVGDNATKISSGTLNQDIEIYRLTAPELNFDGNGIASWSEVANASGYQIVLDNNINIARSKSQTSVSILNDEVDFSSPVNFQFVVNGDVDGNIVNSRVYLNSNAVYRTISKLGTVSLQFGKNNDVDCLTWSGANAGGYKIFATDGETNYQSDVIFQNYFAVSSFVTEQNLSANKQYEIWAKSIALPSTAQDWYISSDDSQKIFVTKLAGVDLSVQDGMIVWDYANTENITGYQAVLKSGEQTINLENIALNENSYDLKTNASGVYTFEIVAVGDASKNFISSAKSSIVISKLNKIENVIVNKTTTTSFDNPLDKYTISFADSNNGNATYICKVDNAVVGLTKNGNNYSFEIYGSQIGETMKVSISVGGDSYQFVNCEGFEINLSKMYEPIVTSNKEGTAIEANANKYFGLIKVANQDLGQQFTGTKTDPINVATGKQFKIKSVAFETEQTVQNAQSLQVDSLFSEVYSVSKLSTPQLSVENGILKVGSTNSNDNISSYSFNFEVNGTKVLAESRNFSNLNSNIQESFGTCVISGYFTDKNSGSMNDGVVYLRSDVSESISVKKLPKPTSVYIRDGVVYVTFEEGQTLFGGKLAIYVNGRDVTSNDNTKTSYDFARNHTDAGKSTVYAKAISQMSGAETSVTYSLHGDQSDTISITKLAKVEEISVTAFAPESGGTVANLVTSISSAQNQLPKSMPYQTGFIRFKAVDSAVSYLITKSTNQNVKLYANKTADSDGYVYVNLQGTDFGSGANSICVTAIGNQKDIIDGETSDTFSFSKLIAPQNVRVENGKIVWTDTNSPNNSSLENKSSFGYNYPAWLFDGSKNAIVYYALINGKYYCTLDLSSMANVDLDELCKLTNDFKDLSYDPNLETTTANVYTIQICASPLNAYIDSSMSEIVNMYINSGNVDFYSLPIKRTNSIYVDSDLSNSILVSPITAPYGLTIENKMLKWLTPYANSSSAESIALNGHGFEVTGYQLRLYKNDELQTFGSGENEKDYISISGASNTQWDFGNYLAGLSSTEGNYTFEVKTIVRQTGSSPSIFYVNSAYSLSFTATALQTPAPGILDGQIAWELVNGSTGYRIIIDDTIEYTTYDNPELFEFIEKDARYKFVGNLSAGEHDVKIQATGGDEKNLISSPIPKIGVKYTKLKKPILYIDSTSGLIKFDEFVDGGQLQPDNDKWSYFAQVEGFDEIDLDHLTTFDMSEKGNQYAGGRIYKITIVARNTGDKFVVGSEDATGMILDSDISDDFLAYKLAAPSRFEVVDNYQSISWTNRDQYVSDVRYIVSIANNMVSTNQQTKYDFDNSGEVNANVFVSAIYDGTVTINGVVYHCLKSDANEDDVSVHKLSAPTNIQIKDGVLSWTRSLDAETHLVIKNTNEVVDIDSYDFADERPGEYKVYLYNLVAEDLRERTDEAIYLSSKNTPEFNIVKLATPTKFNIDQTYKVDDGLKTKYVFNFDNISDASQFTIEIYDGEDNIYSSVLPKQQGVSVIELTFDDGSLGAEIMDRLNAGDFEIYIKAIGSTVAVEDMNAFDKNYASSNTNYLAVDRIEQTDSVDPQTDDILSGTGIMQPTFTGRLDWDSVVDAEKYYVLIEYLGDSDASDFVFVNNGQEVYRYANKKIYQLDKPYCQFAHTGNYDVKVIALPHNVDANMLENRSYHKDIQSADVILEQTLSYSLFVAGDGTHSNPYIISSFEHFNCIRYNTYADYQLSEDIDFSYASNFGRAFDSISEFYGKLDGNDKTLRIAYAENFAGIVETLKENATICNLTIVGSITSLKQGNQIVVGGFATYNYGTIEKCLNKLDQISGLGNKFSVIGGIAAENYGTIRQSGNMANLAGNIVGGIVAKMFGNSVLECYNGSDGSLTIRSRVAQMPSNLGGIAQSTYCGFAGGIVGYIESGDILSCYDYADIYVDNDQTGTAYVAGIVAYADGDVAIKNCYAIDNQIRNVGRLIRATNTDRAKVGILVGLMTENVQIENCVSAYQNLAGTITKAQVVASSVGSGYDGDQIVGVIKGDPKEYQDIYNVVSRDNNDGTFVYYTNKYCTLANAKYN